MVHSPGQASPPLAILEIPLRSHPWTFRRLVLSPKLLFIVAYCSTPPDLILDRGSVVLVICVVVDLGYQHERQTSAMVNPFLWCNPSLQGMRAGYL